MPKYYEEDSVQKARKPCDGLREDLKTCLMNTECVKSGRKTAKDCLLTEPTPECHALRVTFFECKRSLLDMRTRFRGKKGY